MDKATPSQIKLLGKKSTNGQIAIYIKKLFSEPDPLSKIDISKRLSISRPTVNKYLKLADEMGIRADHVKSTAQSKIELSDKAFLDNYYVKIWIKSMDTRDRGGRGGFESKSELLRNFYIVCDTLNITPETFLSANTHEEILDIGRELVTNFMTHYKEGTAKMKRAKNWDAKTVSMAGAAYRFSKAVRDFMRINGHPYPIGEGGVMNQSISKFHGKYANLRMSSETLEIIKKEWLDRFGLDSDEFRFFYFAVESYARRDAIYNALANFNETTTKKGTLIYEMEVIETKTIQYKDGKWSKHIWDLDLQESIRRVKTRSQYLIENRNKTIFLTHIIKLLKETYYKHGLTNQGQLIAGDESSSYYIKKPIHVLRHVGVQRMLLKTNWNVSYIAKHGWKKAQELIDSYGDMPLEQELKVLEGIE